MKSIPVLVPGCETNEYLAQAAHLAIYFDSKQDDFCREVRLSRKNCSTLLEKTNRNYSLLARATIGRICSSLYLALVNSGILFVALVALSYQSGGEKRHSLPPITREISYRNFKRFQKHF